MTEQRLNKIEEAMTKLAGTFGEFLAIEAARKERDKQQLEINMKLSSFIESYKDKDKPVIEAARKHQAWMSFFIGKIELPAIVGAVLLGAGAVIYDKATYKINKN